MMPEDGGETMFTGIISEIGTVAALRRTGGGMRITVSAPATTAALKTGDSVAVEGVCLTEVGREGDRFSVQAVEETLSKTTLGGLTVGTPVNLELALRLGDRLGGHIVQGHVDGLGTVAGIERREGSWFVGFRIGREWTIYVVPVGSVAVNGVSLTVAKCEGDQFWVSLIPHTLEVTTLSGLRAGAGVNLEFDILGKYVHRQLQGKGQGGLDEAKLREWGYLK
jgi:riboflavin synthase